MILSHQEARLVKVVFTILQKSPWEFGVVLEEDGWLEIKELQKVLREEGIKAPSGRGFKRFFELQRPDGLELDDDRIRAISRDFSYSILQEEHMAPDVLFVGIKKRSLEHIRRHGIQGGTRSIVLSSNKDMARRVIARQTGSYLVVEVDARGAVSRGVPILSRGGSLFWARYLPSKWLKLPEPREDGKSKEGKGKGKGEGETKEVKKQPEPPGSFFPGLDPLEVQYLEERARGRKKRWGKNFKKGKRRK